MARTKKICGIYSLTCLPTGDCYIGQSRDIGQRLSTHRCELKAGRHANLNLQQLWDQHRKEEFSFEIVERCSLSQLADRESHWIEQRGNLNIINFTETPSPATDKIRAIRRANMKRLHERPGFAEAHLERTRARHLDPQFREVIAAGRAAWNSRPEVKAQVSKAAKKRWSSDLEYQERNKRAVRKYHADPTVKMGYSARLKKLHENPEFAEASRQRIITHLADPIVKESNRNKMKENNANPEYREKRIAALRAHFENKKREKERDRTTA